MLSSQDLSTVLNSLPFSSKLTPSELSTLQTQMSLHHYRAGEHLMYAQDTCSGLIVVKSGLVRAYMTSEEGKEITLYRLLPQDTCILSASCMLPDLISSVSLELEKDSEIYILPTPILKQLENSNMAVGKYLLSLMSSRFSEVMWVMEQVVFSSMGKRLANFLLDYAHLNETTTLVLTHETIARNLGTAREVVTRLLKYLQTEGYIQLSRGQIDLLDEEGLYHFTD